MGGLDDIGVGTAETVMPGLHAEIVLPFIDFAKIDEKNIRNLYALHDTVPKYIQKHIEFIDFVPGWPGLGNRPASSELNLILNAWRLMSLIYGLA